MNERLSVAKHLTDQEYNYFLETHAAHNRCIGLQERAKYSLNKVVKIKRGKGCLHVHYSNGDWWHYTPQKTWY